MHATRGHVGNPGLASLLRVPYTDLGSHNYPPVQKICHPSLVPWVSLCSISCQHLPSDTCSACSCVCVQILQNCAGPCSNCPHSPSDCSSESSLSRKSSSHHSPDCPVSPLHLPVIRGLPIFHTNSQGVPSAHQQHLVWVGEQQHLGQHCGREERAEGWQLRTRGWL